MSKAQRYTPAAKEAAHQIRYGLKGLLLYLLPLPVLLAAIISLISGSIINTLVMGGAFAAYMLTATIARRGFRLEGEYAKKKIARAPKTPYKTIAALFASVTTGTLAWWIDSDASLISQVLSSTLIGGATFLGFALHYGLDPRKDKDGGLSLGVTMEEVLDALEDANVNINAIEKARKQIKHPDYYAHLGRITDKARDILGSIEDDPTRLSSARKFLKVYLDGTKRVTESYAKSHTGAGTTEALDTDFSNVLNSIETTFNEQHTKLLSNDNFDLDVQISVLEQQLKREGTF